jgi:hypothetical protein
VHRRPNEFGRVRSDVDRFVAIITDDVMKEIMRDPPNYV